MLEPIAFLSYATSDDVHEGGKIAEFCERLSGEVKMQTGKPFHIFRDKKDIGWGENWKKRVEQGLDAATFLIPILTPSYFQSEPCREEYEIFKEREKQLGRNDLILSIYYVECDEIADSAVCRSDPWFIDVSERQYEDWCNLRLKSLNSSTVRYALERLAKQIKQAIKGVTPQLILPDIESTIEKSMGKAVAQPVRPEEITTHIVDSMQQGDFVTISEAIAAAGSGDRVIIRHGCYTEGLVVNKSLEIVGEGGPGDVVVEAEGCNTIIFKTNMGIMRNLTVSQSGGGNWYAVNIIQGQLVLEDCDITSQSLACIAIHNEANPTIRRNRIHDGKRSGIIMYDNALGTIEDNDIFGNALAGIQISGGSNLIVRCNRIHDQKGSGVLMYANSLGTIEYNDIFANGYAGVAIKDGGNPTVRHNRIHDQKESGVFVYENGLGTIEDNDIFGNGYACVAVREGGNPTVCRNNIHDGKQSGIHVYKNGLGTIEGNDIFGNVYAGVAIRDGGNPTVRSNRINRNGYEAVWVYRNGSGIFEENDLRDNGMGAWSIEKGCKVKRARNKVKTSSGTE